MKVIVIGGSHAGIAASRFLKKLDPTTNVCLIEKTKVLGFIPSSVNLIFKGLFSAKEIEKGEVGSQEQLESLGIQVLLETTVTKIDLKTKKVTYQDNLTEQTSEETFDKLILAMGSDRFAPLIPESDVDHPNIITYKSRTKTIEAYQKLNGSEQIAIIGAGLIGLELASSLVEQSNKKITIIEQMNRPVFRYFDEEITDILLQHIPESVDLRLSESFNHCQVVETTGREQLEVQFFSGQTKLVDACVFAVNPKPEVALVENLVALDFDQTILVNDFMQTSDSDVYAIGDLIKLPFGVHGDRAYLPLIGNARKTAFVAASHITLADPKPIPITQRAIGTEIFGIFLGSSGITQDEADFYGFETSSITKTYTHFSNYHTKDDFFATFKVLYDAKTKQLFGAQIISNQKDILDLLNVLTQMIVGHASASDLVFSELYYNPKFSPSTNFLADLGLEALLK
ncbi:FAD-dependent oxidoreductase [Enterococcus thailandicus]|uniref:FAD-dependent oxidoreductase n=1 Tax=Enterococcus thailandicus TaxID=417368 RepID=UPI0022EBBE44|nr:FAD-dependent oxidoreductase [Enterococcus thailandicus]MDA3973172.1 FAD-dependent oxidoreductase [Enterococcus thailandicus]MDA3975394.1 FAD-dependent oxidoreductase [Enterococcus thailandicus]MDA3980632.1 FAD-dependent oxidoreductase [Enterococcus thailandicus]